MVRESLIQGLARLAVDELGINSDWNRGASLVVQHEVSACSAGDVGSIPGSGKPPWRRKWQPTPAFLPGKSHGERSLAGHSPQGCKEFEEEQSRQMGCLLITGSGGLQCMLISSHLEIIQV